MTPSDNAPERTDLTGIKLEIASPCPALWSEMTGDDRSRFCQSCQLTVHNLSAMTTDEAQALLDTASDEGSRVCVRFYKREDGTVLTQDCPVGVELSLRQRLKHEIKQRAKHTASWIRWAAGLAIGVALGSMSISAAWAESKTPPMMGAVAVPMGAPPPQPNPQPPLQGDVAVPPKQTPHKNTDIRGRVNPNQVEQGEAPVKSTKNKPCDIKPIKPTHTMGKVKATPKQNPPLMGKPAPPPPKP